MSQKQISWRHHYIPEFYLKRWAGQTGQLIQFSRPHGHTVKTRRVFPSETGFQDKLYALKDVPAELSDYFEKEYFSPVDNKAALVLDKMEKGILDFSVDERIAWTQFMLTMIFRNPERVEAVKRRLTHDITITSKKSERRYQSSRRPNDPPTLRKAMQGMSDSAELMSLVLQTLTSTSASEIIIPQLAEMKWGRINIVFDVPALLTSDRPIIWERPIEDKKCVILMPTGPKSVFYACHNEDALRTIDAIRGKFALVDYINETVARMAVRFVYGIGAHQFSDIQKCMSVNPPLMISDLFGIATSSRTASRRSKKSMTIKIRR